MEIGCASTPRGSRDDAWSGAVDTATTYRYDAVIPLMSGDISGYSVDFPGHVRGPWWPPSRIAVPGSRQLGPVSKLYEDPISERKPSTGSLEHSGILARLSDARA